MVQTVPGNTWIDGGEENVAVAKTIHYPARLTDDKIMMKDFPNAEIWNYIVNPSLVAAGGPTPIYTTSYWSSTEAYYSPNNAYAIHFPDATLESNDKYL